MKRDYFHKTANYIWHYDEEEDLFIIDDGTTIAYSAYVQEMFKDLCFQGLPPFGTFLMLLISMQKEEKIDLANIITIFNHLQTYDKENLPRIIKNGLNAFLSLHKSFREIPDKYKDGEKKILLLQILCKDCHNIIGLNDSKQIAENFHELCKQKNVVAPRQEDAMLKIDEVIERDLISLYHIEKKFPNAEAIMDAIDKLPIINEELLLEESEISQETEIEFPEDLVNNLKTHKVGSLIKHLWSGLNIPMHHAVHGDLPLGGVSDLSNKGNFDNLLLTEYANDDDLFLSRLANNEALFLKRESPPQHDSFERQVLIDSSIQNWGAVKLMAHALLLAIAKHPKTNIPCKAFLMGNNYQEIYFENLSDVIENLDKLEASLDASQGLESFLRIEKPSKFPSLFWICSKDSFQSAAIQKLIQKYRERFKYWIIIDRVGIIKIFRNTRKGMKYIQTIHLALEQLWEKKEDLDEIEQNTNLKYPILLPNITSFKQILCLEKQIYKVTKDRCLMKAFINNKRIVGWEVIYEGIPSGNTKFSIGKSEYGLHLLCENKQRRKISIIDIQEDIVREIDSNLSYSYLFTHYIFEDGYFYYVKNNSLRTRISFIGKLAIEEQKEDSSHLIAAHKEYVEALKYATNLNEQINHSTLINVHKVFINEDDLLVLNNHVLSLDKNKTNVQWVSGLKKNRWIQAEAERTAFKSTFEFKNGCQVIIDRKGMMTLSYEEENIFIPLKLNKALTMASNKTVCIVNDKRELINGDHTIIRTKEFYKNFIMAFIDKILKHEV